VKTKVGSQINRKEKCIKLKGFVCIVKVKYNVVYHTIKTYDEGRAAGGGGV
jgi:hypothetical protein